MRTAFSGVRIDYRQDDTFYCSPDDSFPVEAGISRLSMTSLYEAIILMRIALLNPQAVLIMMVSDDCPPYSRNLPDLTSMRYRSKLLFRRNERYVSCFENSDGKGL